MNWIKVPNSQFIRILEKCPDRDSNQGAIGYTTVTAISFKPKATRKRLKKEILSDEFKKRKIFRTGKFSMENFPPHITSYTPKERTPVTHWIGGWVGHRACQDTEATGKSLCLY
jgi:hypothetical protein